MVGDEFATLLGQLKQRSGLSYGALGKRLHLSGSTLHRYVTGEAVPADYAPVERFARLCKATPDELVELHRLWVHADVTRRRKGATPEPTPAPPPAQEPTPEAPAPTPEAHDEMVVTGPAPTAEPRPRRAWRRPTVAIAGAAVVAAVASVALVLNLPAGADGDGKRATTGASSAPDTKSPSSTPALNVATNAYKWEGPCSQHYLMDRPPAQVPPPPTEPDAPGWVSALGGVAAGEQLLALTVQGTGKQTVVLEALHVRVVKKGAPLPWNDYSMGVGCGGDVSTKSFGVDLDSGRPDVTPRSGRRDFPYKVSESDPEVFYVKAKAEAHDVSWYLELDWSSGSRHGTVRIDDDGKPFRTSGNLGRPGYDHPLGGSEWIDRPKEDNSTQWP
ncbi:helix-turn-helix domain-containing protein [Streptomyces sp. NPDC054975]